ncbi:MAG: radical SAM protein [Deltaproteobacteria bacterium]|nr:radical SAM protein [Deltaproteobacteria bacterium]
MNLDKQSVYLRFGAGLVARKPFNVLIQVTNRCNLKCSFCDFWPNGAHPREELTIEDYRKLASDLARLGTFLISIEGGEPFIRPDLIEIVRVFGEQHLPVLYTNGWYVTPENARKLFDAGLHQVGVSIDYPDAARHDAKRGAKGTYERAWAAIEAFKGAAPGGGKQVHVMTVLMKDNQADFERLLEMSGEHGVGHNITLISRKGFRRGKESVDQFPTAPLSVDLERLWRKHAHFRIFRDYLRRFDSFVTGGDLPQCRAGQQSFNIDHLGYVSTCIEKIDHPVGNVRDEAIYEIHKRLERVEEVKTCQDCWTLCRGFGQILGNGASLNAFRDLMGRMGP